MYYIEYWRVVGSLTSERYEKVYAKKETFDDMIDLLHRIEDDPAMKLDSVRHEQIIFHQISI